MGTYLKKVEVAENDPACATWCSEDFEDAVRWPALQEFLCVAVWPDGSSRTTGTITVFVDEGKLKACLNDRAQGLVAFRSAESVLGLFDQLEGLLRGTSGDWRRHRENKLPARRK